MYSARKYARPNFRAIVPKKPDIVAIRSHFQMTVRSCTRARYSECLIGLSPLHALSMITWTYSIKCLSHYIFKDLYVFRVKPVSHLTYYDMPTPVDFADMWRPSLIGPSYPPSLRLSPTITKMRETAEK